VVRYESWDEVGGNASIGAGAYGCLTISQTTKAFDEIDEFLAAYRKVLAQYREDGKAVHTKAMAVDEARHGKLRSILKEKAKPAEFKKMALVDVVDALAHFNKVRIQINHRSLETVGIGSDLPITAVLEDEPLGAALRRMLKPHKLTWALQDEVILITTPEEEESKTVVKVYPIGDLVDREDDLDVNARRGRCDALVDMVLERVDPDSWEDVGGMGMIKMPLHSVLVVAQREEIHDQLAALLAKVRSGEVRLNEAAGHDPSRRSVNARGEILFTKNYELKSFDLEEVTVEETAALAELARELLETRPWNDGDGYSIRASMAGATLVVRHNAATHRKIQRLLIDLEVYGGELLGQGVGGGLGGGFGGGLGGGGFGGGFGTISRLPSFSLPATHPDNALDKSLVLRVIRLAKEEEGDKKETPEELAEVIRRQVEPKSWAEGGTAVVIRPFRRNLVVRHTATTQREIFRLLEEKEALLKPQPLAGGFF
jgi:hypothetical protein